LLLTSIRVYVWESGVRSQKSGGVEEIKDVKE
jgi:hypothetical protein